MKNHKLTAGLVLALAASALTPSALADLPARPEQIEFKPLAFTPPNAKDYRRTLSNGVAVYLAPSKEVPLVSINFTFRGGAYLEPQGKAGLARMTGSMLRRGGTATIKPADLDEEFDFLAAMCMTSVGGTSASASLNSLTSNLDQSFKLFMDVIRNPGFDSERTELLRKEVTEEMKQRNDDASTIMGREASAFFWGRDHFEGRVATKSEIDSISIDDMKAFHAKLFQPGNLIIGVTGDFEESSMLARLEQAMQGWNKGDKMPDPPAPTNQIKPGVYHVEKDIPQGKFQIMSQGIKRDDPDAIAIEMMNDVLGGSGFTSRIMNRVRTDEGLAYGAGSGFASRVYYPGQFIARFDSKNETCALAGKIVFEEFNKIRTEKVSPEELEVVKNAAIETFPQNFASKAGFINLFISDEWTNRPADYWQNYRDRVKAVTTDDVLRVAQRTIDPAKMAVFIVGKWEPIAKGDVNGRATMQHFTDFFGSEVNHLPLRDPLTDAPLPEQPKVEGGNETKPTR
ncbi:MAG: M16 family metallopeptidase [Phycisphaerales bacterium]